MALKRSQMVENAQENAQGSCKRLGPVNSCNDERLGTFEIEHLERIGKRSRLRSRIERSTAHERQLTFHRDEMCY